MNIFLKKFIEKKFVKPGKALDLGAGKLFNVALLSKLGWKCKGVDKNTGIDLNKFYRDPSRSYFDLIFSTYVLHKLQQPRNLIKTAFANLKHKGWLFIQTFNESDKTGSSNFNQNSIREMLKSEGFIKIRTKVYKFYDNEKGHKHWHKILEVTAQKK